MRAMRMSTTLLLTLTLIMPAASLVAQQAPAKQTPPPEAAQAPLQDPWRNPVAGPEHRRLAFFIGQWDEEVNYAAEGARGRGRWVARPAMGLFVMFNYEGRGPQGPYRAHGVLTYARDEQAYRMWWFDDAGGIGEYRGNFTDQNTLVLEHRGKVEGRTMRERITYTRVSPMEIRTKIEQAWDSGDYTPYLEATAHRTGDVPRQLGPPGAQRPRMGPPQTPPPPA